ncbi:MAG TPA: serine hydrolase [Anaerolineales bacterium]|nr:serine hydrolase [Anaerolineales bacterium]
MLSRKNMTNTLVAALVIAGIIVIAYFVVASRTDTFTGRWVAWKSSGVDDYSLFPFDTINHSPSTFTFNNINEDFPIQDITYEFNGKTQTTNLDVLLEKTETTAFIVIQGDTILYENYFNGYQRDSIVTSFSVAKSLTSLLIGMAIDDGYIQSIDQPVTQYIPELSQVDPEYQSITLRHLLSMKSGIAFKDTDIPWHDKSKAYYHPYLREVVTHLPLAEPPDTTFVYNTFNPIILGIVLENATGQSVADYFETRLWMRLGAEYDASWSLDSTEDGMAKMESGFNARAIDFAKIGGLILNQGNWNGEQIISAEWINDSIKIEAENLVPEFGENVYYQNGWWIISPTAKDKYTVFAWGHLGQYLFIFPDDGMIILRFGEQIGEVDSWRQIAQEIVKAVNEK